MPKQKLTPFGITIKKRLIEYNMTQNELAEVIGTSTQYLNLIMYGKRKGTKYLDKIHEVLEINS